MKLLPEKKGLEKLDAIRSDLRRTVVENYERKARSCAACATPGACCRDEHFVNVRITRLEAAAIAKRLGELDEDTLAAVAARIDRAIEKYSLYDPGYAVERTYACPLFEPGAGCLVHETAKPLPCIAHACYENESDLPPDELLDAAEKLVDDLNRRIYGRSTEFEPIPVAVRRRMKF